MALHPGLLIVRLTSGVTKTMNVKMVHSTFGWVGILAYGEGWHNNHHFNPRVAKAGQRWWEIDVTWWAIRVLQSLSLAKKIVS